MPIKTFITIADISR